MSLEKLAQDAYTQGLTDTLRTMEISDDVKIAAYKSASIVVPVLAAGGITGALGAEKGDVTEGTLAGIKNVSEKGIKGALGGAALFGLLNAATRGKMPDGRRITNMMAMKAGGGIGGTIGGGAASLQNLVGGTGVGSRMGLKNEHYAGHDDFYDDHVGPKVLDAIIGLGT